MRNAKMKNWLTRLCWRRKLFANPVRSLSLALCLLGVPLPSNNIIAQTTNQPSAPPKSASLPRAFARFSTSDVFKQIFDSYDSKTGRVASVHNLKGKPALVEINTTALWKVQGQDQLVVLIDVAGDDEITGLCGNCLANSFLAVLKKKGAALSLVARQLNLPASSAPVEYESLDPDQLVQYTGHDDVSLDLAPYKLNGRENLIGVRLEHMWLPALDWSTTLSLYRIEGRRLREVFRKPVVEREYREAAGGSDRTIEKTTSTISLLPTSQPAGLKFNDLVIKKITVRCLNKYGDDDCNSEHEGFREIRTQRELWQFDGHQYTRSAPIKQSQLLKSPGVYSPNATNSPRR